MSSIILKPKYQVNYGFRINQSTKGIFTWLENWCKEVKRPTDKQIEINGLPPKGDCPGFCAVALKPKFNAARCYITAEVMDTTDVLVLDIDDVPANVSNVSLWLPKVLPQGVKAFWYSTPRYRDAKKRVRVVIRLNREITAEEKKSLQKRLPIPGVDPASYEINKFSLLPCWCEDTQDFCWGSIGHRELDMDRDLPAWIPERKRSYVPNIRLEALAEIAKVLVDIVEKINDAPDGGSQEVIKSNLSKAFRKYAIKYEYCEAYAQFIYRADRAKDFLGIARWLENRYRR